jgi:hypothetical protein
MTDEKSTPEPSADDELEREIREGRKFTLEEAVARMVGPGGMKGESPITRLRQAEVEIGNWLATHLADAGGALGAVLHRHIRRSELLLTKFEQPLVALSSYCQQLLANEFSLQELVRDADVEWGRLMGERPHFEKPGSPPNPDDPYTIESVRRTLTNVVQQLASAG